MKELILGIILTYCLASYIIMYFALKSAVENPVWRGFWWAFSPILLAMFIIKTVIIP